MITEDSKRPKSSSAWNAWDADMALKLNHAPMSIGFDKAGQDHTAVAVFDRGRIVRHIVIPTRRPAYWKAWRLVQIARFRLEIWLDVRYLKRARLEGILETGSESLHAAEARLWLARVQLAIWEQS